MACVDRKNLWRRIEANKVREQRIITGYVSLKHPEVYKEAVEFYELLNEKYPGKKDLRKTNEYEWLKTGISGESMKKFYSQRTKCPGIKEKVSSKINKEKVSSKINKEKVSSKINKEKVLSKINNTDDNMQLIIPLMKQHMTSTEPPVELQTELIGNAATGQGETLEINQDIMIEDAEIVIDSSLGDKIPDNVIDEIMEGLRQDPDLYNLFDDLDIEIDDIDEISPLENELMHW